MFIKRRSNILYRDFQTFGYLTDNRNFGYKLKTADEGFVGDKIVSQSGAVFLSALSRKPQKLDELAARINSSFPDVDIETIKEDAREFFGSLENEGFIVSGNSEQECNDKDTRFSYANVVHGRNEESTSSAYQPPIQPTQKFLEKHLEGRQQLTNVHIEITGRCNETCVHCYIPRNSRSLEMERSTFEDILRQCKEMNVLHLTLSGGEPMLHRDFIDFIRKCRELEFSVNILSNLTLLTSEIIAEMKKNYLLGVQVSLYSMNPVVHDEITGAKGSFEKTRNSIQRLIENDVPLQIACPIMKNNKTCYKTVIDWAKKLKINAGTDYVILARHNNTTENLGCRLSTDEVKDIITERAQSDSNFIKQIKEDALKRKDFSIEDNVCSVCNSSICINERGNVYPCAGWQGYVVGNIKNIPLEQIWNHSEKVEYLRGLRRKDFPKCTQCADREFCTMCLVRNANETPSGDPLVTNPHYCAVAELNKAFVHDYQMRQAAPEGV